MRNLLDSEEYEFRYEIGIAQPSGTLQLSDLDRIVETSATHYSIVSVKAELDQIIDGLTTLEVLDLIVHNPNGMEALFVYSIPPPLTADKMVDMFQPRFSPTGANRREVEEAVVMQWIHYLQLIESRLICL